MTLWRDGLWLKLWEMDVRGKVWRVIKQIYAFSRSVVFLEGETSVVWKKVWHRVVACPLYCFPFLLMIS